MRALFALLATLTVAACGPGASATPTGSIACATTCSTTAQGWTLSTSPSGKDLAVTVTAPSGTQLRGYCGGPSIHAWLEDSAHHQMPNAPRVYADYCSVSPVATDKDLIDLPTTPSVYTVHATVRLAGASQDVAVPVILTIQVG